MNHKEIKSMRREIALRPYKRAFHTMQQLGSTLFISGIAVIGGWVLLVGFLSITL